MGIPASVENEMIGSGVAECGQEGKYHVELLLSHATSFITISPVKGKDNYIAEYNQSRMT